MAAPTKKNTSVACVIPGGFTVLSLKFCSNSTVQHQLCVKEHRVRAETNAHRPQDRTLFVLNIPPYCSQSVVKDIFSRFGPVQHVELSEKPGAVEDKRPDLSPYFTPAQKRCFKVAYVVFKHSSGVAAAKAHPYDSPLIVSTTEKPVQTGLKKWIHEYKQTFIKPELLQKAVDDFMSQYDKRKEEEEERQKKEVEEQQEDEDGWVKVTKGGKSMKSRPHSEAANQRVLQKEHNKKKRKELLNFYTWQHRDSKREHIAELRRKFEEDKQRIALLRAQRKFRPY
ncbi:ribosomal RNA-processing protein 7 homolog A-like isoform X2 [Tachysurus fulvidraco]|uniref:ribosomal RNA-processing protein 7 homolog A isoform X2 n=1 Tax=Tachysurus fulvidraco TaxID=1234273 RepID=UPI001FEE8822|nr:ribosomal RNA-processing protein 7 homolog A isoform X2 [Tachysurus fulvidraco]XP_047672222.1 ribosomal RNA-processing protein 7 homolog A-like isoform X2 [Tachysurus fulvidraco]